MSGSDGEPVPPDPQPVDFWQQLSLDARSVAGAEMGERVRYLPGGSEDGADEFEVMVDRESSYFDETTSTQRRIVRVDIPRGPCGISVIEPGLDLIEVADEFGGEPLRHRVMRIAEHQPHLTTVEVQR